MSSAHCCAARECSCHPSVDQYPNKASKFSPKSSSSTHTRSPFIYSPSVSASHSTHHSVTRRLLAQQCLHWQKRTNERTETIPPSNCIQNCYAKCVKLKDRSIAKRRPETISIHWVTMVMVMVKWHHTRKYVRRVVKTASPPHPTRKPAFAFALLALALVLALALALIRLDYGVKPRAPPERLMRWMSLLSSESP
jgi:hypothetical protein